MKNLLSLLAMTVLCGSSAFTQTSRTWTGSTSTAWGTASNWSPSGVPATIDHVAIPNTTNKPKLSSNVTIANFSITGGELDLDSDTLTVNGTLNMTGGVVKDGLLKKTSTSAITITGVTVECALDITGTSISVTGSRFLHMASLTATGGTNALAGNVWEAALHLTNVGVSSSNMSIGLSQPDTVLSDLTMTNNGRAFTLGNATTSPALVFAGSGLQQLKITTTGISGRRVTINKPTGSVLLSGELTITNFLNLTKGIVRCESGAQVTMNSGATASGTSNLSYIEGPVLKKGNQAFTFPVGRNGAYRPISITAPASSTHSFKAEYFESDSDPLYSHSSKDGSLNHLSKNEYWTLTRVAGVSTPKVTLSWDTLTSCIMNTPLSAIHVASWNGSQWKDLGNGGTTGNIHKGTIQTTYAVATFNAFILEHDSGMSLCGREVDFDWTPGGTISEGDTVTFNNLSVNYPSHYKYVWTVDHCWISGYCGDTLDLSSDFVRAFSYGIYAITLRAVNSLGNVVGKVTKQLKVLPADYLDCNCLPDMNCDLVGNGSFSSRYTNPSQAAGHSNFYCWLRDSDVEGNEGECVPFEFACDVSLETYSQVFLPSYCVGENNLHPNFSIPTNMFSVDIQVYEPGQTTADENSAYAVLRTWASLVSPDVVPSHTYLVTELLENLNSGQAYTIAFDARLSKRSSRTSPIAVAFANDYGCHEAQAVFGGPVATTITSADLPGSQMIEFLPSTVSGFLHGFNDWHSCEAVFTASDDFTWMYIGGLYPATAFPNWSYAQQGSQPFTIYHENGTSLANETRFFIDNVSITAVPPTITQGAGLCRTGSPITLNVTGSGTGSNIYTWSASPSDASLIGQENDMEIEVNPSAATTTYTVTVQGPDGCELTDQIIISSDYCCLPSSGSTTYINATLSGTQMLTGHFAINGTFTLEPGADITFDGATVNMGPNAEIFLPPTASLTITDDSHIRACDDMWNRIYVSNNASITVSGQSKIEDALNAIHMEDGADFIIDGAVFNRNLIHLFIRAPFISPVHSATTIKNSQFLCQTTASIGGSPVHENLHEPYDSDITFAGVAGVNIRGLSIGVKDNGNIFDNTEFGVFATEVDAFAAVENTFTDITQAGMYVTECGEGDRDIDIIDNVMSKMPYGIYCYDNPEAEIKIEGNEIDFTGMSSPPQYMTGITVEEITPGSPPSAPNKVSIHDNDINLAPCGIRVDNLAGYLLVPSTYIGFNTVYNEKTHNDEQAGILVENSSGVIVSDNTVKHNSKSGYETGIRIGGGNTNWLFCNTVEDLNKGLFFDNDQRPSTLLVQNTMDNNQTGIFLNNAKIGAQGSLSQAQDNEWLGTYTMSPNPHNPHTETYGVDAVGALSPFFVRNTGTLNPTENANTNGAPSAISTQIVTTAWSLGCPFTAPSYKAEEEQTPDVSSALSILNAEGEPQTMREASIRWAGEYGLYKQLLADETMRYMDESLSAFFNEKEVGNMGKLHRAITDFNPLRHSNGSDLLSANVSEQLSVVVNGLSSENHVEQRLGEVLGILYANIDDLKAIGGYEEARLRQIAQLCPLDEGFGVYIARSALLKLDTLPQHYMNECERMPDTQSMESWKTSQTELKEFSVYPNPNNGSFAINYRLNDHETGTVHLFNVLGHVVYQAQLDASATVLNLSIGGLSSGIYILRVDVNGENRLVERISVLSTNE